MNSDPYIHLGQWTNWADGPFRGPRLTLTASEGAYLIAILALFVRLAGQHSWCLLCYIIFQYRDGKSAEGTAGRDVLQVILRNAQVDMTAAWHFLTIFRRRRPAKGFFHRAAVYLLLAVFHALVFTAAGVFVSKVTETGQDKVLIRGHTCGIWQDPADFDLYDSGSAPDVLENALWSTWQAQTATSASDFSRQCYNTTTGATSDPALTDCNAYAPNLLTWHVDENVTCPFDDKMCMDGLAVQFDTGYLDSLSHFGVNAKESDRVKYRRVVECAPLARDGYISGDLNVSQVNWGPDTEADAGGRPDPSATYQEFFYGPNVALNLTSTYVWNNATIGINFGQMELPGFAIDAELYTFHSPEDGSFMPIQELNRTTGDVVIFFLSVSSFVEYLSPVHDPWFRATTPNGGAFAYSFTSAGNGSLTTYKSDYGASAVSCTERYQYCNHDASKCSILTGSGYGGSLNDSIGALAEGLDLNNKQKSTLSRIIQSSWNQDMYLASDSPTGLLVQSMIPNSLGPAVPDNQWILEMQHYFLTCLTGMQIELTTFATGPLDKGSFQYLTAPRADEEWMCSSQIVQRSGYSTFSLLGIVIVILVGSLMIITNLALPTIVKRCRHGLHGTGKDNWEAYHYLELAQGHDRVEMAVHATDSFPQISENNDLKFSRSFDVGQGVGHFQQVGTEDHGTDTWTAPSLTSNLFGNDRVKSWTKIRELPRPGHKKQGSEGSMLMGDLDRG